MKIINLTLHDITIMNEEKEISLVIPPSGKVARLDSDKELIKNEEVYYLFPDDKNTISFYATKYGIPILTEFDKNGEEVNRSQFPICQEDIIYIVSGLFRSGYPRIDLWQPGELVKNEKGNPIGCIGLSQ